jgi:hypothetical protein
MLSASAEQASAMYLGIGDVPDSQAIMVLREQPSCLAASARDQPKRWRQVVMWIGCMVVVLSG